MAQRANGLTHRVRYLLAQADDSPDAELLSRFVEDRDAEAFARLVRRHGPMVLGVCRRVLRNAADADDAFQATFLVLARRAGAVRPRSRLGNWLYGVAYRTALEARRAAAVRRDRERRAAEMRPTTTAANDAQPDLREVLDQELAALPEVYRAAVVLCDLEGLSRREAATQLGWSEGTLSGRLARARSLLAGRLARHGLSVPAAGVGALTSAASGTGVPPALVESTVRIGVLFAAGEVAAVAAAPVVALTEGVMKAMLLAKLKGMATALVVGCALLAGATAGWRSHAVGAGDGQAGGQPPAKAGRDADKERIAQLERERDELLKQVRELQLRVEKLEAGRGRGGADVGGADEVMRRAKLLEEEKARAANGQPNQNPITDAARQKLLEEERARAAVANAGTDRSASLEARVKQLEADLQKLLAEVERLRKK